MTFTIGIDPGMEGAVVQVSGDSMPLIWDTPTLDAATKDRASRRMYNEVEMARILRRAAGLLPGQVPPENVSVVIEQVHSMPKQGVASAFTFGMGYGIWLGIIGALGLRSRRVTPQRWKKDVLADGPKTDQSVVAFGARLYPAVSEKLQTPRGRLFLGRADALLIAHWGATHPG